MATQGNKESSVATRNFATVGILGTKAELMGSSWVVASLLSSFIAANNTTASFEDSCIIAVVATTVVSSVRNKPLVMDII